MGQRRKRQTEKASLKKVFGFHLPSTMEIVQNKPLIHISCDGTIEIEYSKGILQYSNTQIELDMGNICLCINGDDLTIGTLLQNKLTINGRIFSVDFRYEKGGAKD